MILTDMWLLPSSQKLFFFLQQIETMAERGIDYINELWYV